MNVHDTKTINKMETEKQNYNELMNTIEDLRYRSAWGIFDEDIDTDLLDNTIEMLSKIAIKHIMKFYSYKYPEYSEKLRKESAENHVKRGLQI